MDQNFGGGRSQMTTETSQQLEPFETVSLELLRPGPAHGQLLSPLTPYVALCGDEGPVTLRIDLEHWSLLNRLRRLRYVVSQGQQQGLGVVPDPVREAEVLELGGEVSRILANIPTLGSELGRAAGRLGPTAEGGSGLVHLRFIISGSELSLIPFELVISPQGYPGDGVAMLLQSDMPIIVTREVRRGRPSSLSWNQTPRVLFVAAAPDNLVVPQKAHLHAIRQALDPWIRWGPAEQPEPRVESIKQQLTVLLNASVEDIKQACATKDYTHVHILAHGDSYDEAGQPRYGVALCDHYERSKKTVVDGKRLAEALLATQNEQRGRSRPLVVTLATCDSGNVRSVVVPGGSIAHDLHASGIPWVFASQFPLTIAGSVRMTEVLYKRLFRGEDPRRLLYRLRTALHVSGRTDHDWASLVAYASVPDDLDHQVHWFRSKQMRRAIEVDLDLAEQLEETSQDWAKVEEAIDNARSWLDRWEAGLPPGEGEDERALRAECYGVYGATLKRAAEQFFKLSQRKELQESAKEKERKALHEARLRYEQAMGKGLKELQHWPAAQYLSLTAVLGLECDRDTYYGTVTWAKQGLLNESNEQQAWANGTLAELEMLRIYHDPDSVADPDEVKNKVARHCKQILQLMGKDSFTVLSTLRQFRRYCTWWRHKAWQGIAEAAVAVLKSNDS